MKIGPLLAKLWPPKVGMSTLGMSLPLLDPYTERNHYFFICAQYSVDRNEMLTKINIILQTSNMNIRITPELLLCGNKKFSYTFNTQTLDAVHTLIRKFLYLLTLIISSQRAM